jgi:hypothetical protein
LQLAEILKCNLNLNTRNRYYKYLHFLILHLGFSTFGFEKYNKIIKAERKGGHFTLKWLIAKNYWFGKNQNTIYFMDTAVSAFAGNDK